MKCVNCGTELEEGVLLCPVCGRVVSTEEAVMGKAAAGHLTKKEFYKLPGMKTCRNSILTCAIVLYVCAGITLLAALLVEALSASILDAILLVALGLWLQLGKSRVCAIITACYGIFGTGIVLVTTGKVQGWWIPVAGIFAIIYTFKFHKMWDQYQKDGVLPAEAVKKK